MTAQLGDAERLRLMTAACEKTDEQGWSGLRKQNPSLKLLKAADNCFCTQRLFLNMRKLTATNCSSVFPLPLVTIPVFLPWLERKSGSRKQVKRQPHLYIRKHLYSMEVSILK